MGGWVWMVGVVEMGVGKIELFVWGWDGGKGGRKRKRLGDDAGKRGGREVWGWGMGSEKGAKMG